MRGESPVTYAVAWRSVRRKDVIVSSHPDLTGRTALVTGAASGIGEACARRLAAAGARVVVLDRSAEAAAEVAADIGADTLVVDLADPDAIDAALDGLHVPVDILVNNAGLQHVAPIGEFPTERWDTIIAVMLTAPFRLARRLVPAMADRGWGRIINVSSAHGHRASPFKSAYVSAKHGLEGLSKVIALEGGAHMHYCHVTSTSTFHVDRVLELIEDARDEGGAVTVEAYPYGAGSTAISAQFLAPDQLGLRGLRPQSLVMVGSGERIATVERLVELRATDPGANVLVEFLDDAVEAHRAILRRALSFPGTIMASDAMPLVAPAAVEDVDQVDWPIPPGWTTHPRTAGTFTRSLRLLVDEVGESWSDALARCSLLPARTLERAVPTMANKGRLRPGADADLVVFDPAALRDRATYLDGTRPSEGVRHLLVNGEAVIRDGVLDLRARPGRPIRAN